MIINHNLPAINAHRQMGINNNNISKSLEKLSSGLGINRASDNAAGLAISEKMRGQISGLNQASTNAQDGISLIQTAEGALNETHSILQRMRELSVQSANGTYQDEVDRENIQKEVDALKSEVDRIATSTHYNNIKLLDGSLGGTAGSTAAGPVAGSVGTGSIAGAYFTSNVAGTSLAVNVANVTEKGGENAQWDATGKALTLNLVADQTYTQAQIDDLIANATQASSATPSAPATVSLKLDGGSFKAAAGAAPATDLGVKAAVTTATGITDITGANVATTITSNKYGADATVFTFNFDAAEGKEGAERTGAAAVTISLQSGKEYSDSELTELLNKAGLDYTVSFADSNKKIGATTTAATFATAALAGGAGVPSFDPNDTSATGKGLTFQIGANGTADQKAYLEINDHTTKGLKVKDISVSTRESSNRAIDIIDDAVNYVSSTRADLGALQNRLEYAINSLNTTGENLTASESRIRDTDMAKEMSNFTKSNIIQQAAQAMLAQANAQPQAVLQLLA